VSCFRGRACELGIELLGRDATAVNEGTQTSRDMLSNFQNAFVRIAADQRFRDRFLIDPTRALAAYDLSARERLALCGISGSALSRYADALLSKRMRALAKAVPFTLRVCPSLPQRYRRWLAVNPAPRRVTVLPPGLAEALRSVEVLRAQIDRDAAEATYAGGVFAFEVFANASRLDARERETCSRHRLDVIFDTLRKGLLPMDPDVVPTRFIFGRDGVAWHSVSAETTLT